MARPIVMPSFGMYTAEGTLTAWRKPSGAWVEFGETVLEIETEKAVQEVRSPAQWCTASRARHGSATASGVADRVCSRTRGSAAGQFSESVRSPPPAPLPSRSTSSGPRRELRASPLAKRLAAEHGIDLTTLTGNGPEGRIVEADIRSRDVAVTCAAAGRCTRRPPVAFHSQSCADVSASVSAASSTRPCPVTLMREVRAEALVAARSALMEKLGQAIPYDAFFVKLLAAGLRQFPQLNATIEDGELLVFSETNIGFAVALEDGLVGASRPCGRYANVGRCYRRPSAD